MQGLVITWMGDCLKTDKHSPPRLSQPSIFHGMVKWVSAFELN